MSKKNIVPSVFPNDSTPTRVYYFCVPDIDQWRELFIGHLLGMTYGYFWDKNSGDFDEARNVMSDIVFSGISNSTVNCLCDAVADCILNSQAVKDALDTQNSSETTGNNSQNLTAGMDTNNCNDDNLFGATIELVNELNAYAVDAFEIIESSTNFLELMSEFLGAIPVAGDVLALIPNLLNFFQEVGVETYNASFTTILRDEIACDLFCIYRENCELSLDDVFDYLWSEFSSSAQPQSITEAIDAFVAIGVVVGRITVFGVFMIALSFIKLGDGNLPSLPFVALPSTNRLRIALAVGLTTPNASHSVLCDPCSGQWCEEIDFTTGDGQFSPLSVDAGNAGTWSIGNGWADGQHRIGSTRYYRGVRIIRNIPATRVTSIDFEIDYVKGNSDNPTLPALAIRDSNGDLTLIEHQDASTGVQTISWSGFAANVTQIYLLAITSAQSSPTYTGSAVIKSVTICGDGSNPF